MTSKLKVNILADGGDNAIMTSNGSGTLTLNNAALKATPAFLAWINGAGSGQTISNLTQTVIALNQEVFDTDGKFNTSDYKFTPTIAGKYFIFGQVRLETDTNFNPFEASILKNGSTELARAQGVYGHYDIGYTSTIADLDADDYIQLRVYQGSGSNKEVSGYQSMTFMGGYRIIGA